MHILEVVAMERGRDTELWSGYKGAYQQFSLN